MSRDSPVCNTNPFLCGQKLLWKFISEGALRPILLNDSPVNWNLALGTGDVYPVSPLTKPIQPTCRYLLSTGKSLNHKSEQQVNRDNSNLYTPQDQDYNSCDPFEQIQQKLKGNNLSPKSPHCGDDYCDKPDEQLDSEYPLFLKRSGCRCNELVDETDREIYSDRSGCKCNELVDETDAFRDTNFSASTSQDCIFTNKKIELKVETSQSTGITQNLHKETACLQVKKSTDQDPESKDITQDVKSPNALNPKDYNLDKEVNSQPAQVIQTSAPDTCETHLQIEQSPNQAVETEESVEMACRRSTPSMCSRSNLSACAMPSTSTCSRPNTSACSRPSSACSRPSSAGSRPSSACSRPSSACSRPTSACSRPTPTCSRPTSQCSRPASACSKPLSACSAPASSACTRMSRDCGSNSYVSRPSSTQNSHGSYTITPGACGSGYRACSGRAPSTYGRTQVSSTQVYQGQACSINDLCSGVSQAPSRSTDSYVTGCPKIIPKSQSQNIPCNLTGASNPKKAGSEKQGSRICVGSNVYVKAVTLPCLLSTKKQRRILGVVKYVTDDGKYKIGTRRGVIGQLFDESEVEPCSTSRLTMTDVPPGSVTLKEASLCAV